MEKRRRQRSLGLREEGRNDEEEDRKEKAHQKPAADVPRGKGKICQPGQKSDEGSGRRGEAMHWEALDQDL
jgi:hypothetical protein